MSKIQDGQNKQTYWIGLKYKDDLGTWMWNSGEKLNHGGNWKHWVRIRDVWNGRYGTRQVEPTRQQSRYTSDVELYTCANVQTGQQSGVSVETTVCNCKRPVVCIKCKLCRHSISGDNFFKHCNDITKQN